MSPSEARQVEALQSMWSMRLNVRPSLSMGQQLRWQRKLPVLHGFTAQSWIDRDLWRLSELVDFTAIPDD